MDTNPVKPVFFKLCQKITDFKTFAYCTINICSCRDYSTQSWIMVRLLLLIEINLLKLLTLFLYFKFKKPVYFKNVSSTLGFNTSVVLQFLLRVSKQVAHIFKGFSFLTIFSSELWIILVQISRSYTMHVAYLQNSSWK